MGVAKARIPLLSKVRGGLRDGHWFWAVQIDEHFRPWNGGTGYCETSREAMEAVEARAPKLLG